MHSNQTIHKIERENAEARAILARAPAGGAEAKFEADIKEAQTRLQPQA